MLIMLIVLIMIILITKIVRSGLGNSFLKEGKYEFEYEVADTSN